MNLNNPHGLLQMSMSCNYVPPAIDQEQPSIQRDVSPIRRIGDGDNIIGYDVEARLSYEFALPADIESAGRYQIQARSLEEKAFRCLRIAQFIFRNTTTASFQKIETMAALLMQLPDNSIETIRSLLEDFTVEQVPEKPPDKPKSLNRFQILKQV